MTAEHWFLIAVIGFSLSGVALIVAVFMFIKLNIPSVIGDLNGKTVAREIRAMREANSNAVNDRPGGLMPMYSRKTGRTTRLRGSTGPLKGTTGPLRKAGAPSGEMPKNAGAAATSVLNNGDSGATSVLGDAGATSVLTANNTPATSVLNDNTTNPIPTTNVAVNNATAVESQAVAFQVTRSLVFVHTTETI